MKEADEATRDKMMMMTYLSALSLDKQTVNIPSSFLLPTLTPSNLEVLEVDKCKGAAFAVNGPYAQQSLPSLNPVVGIEQDKDDVKDSH